MGYEPKMRFIVWVDPSPKLRPRFSSISKRAYTPAKCTNYQNEVRRQVVTSLGPGTSFPIFEVDVPLTVDMDFVSKMPKSHPGNKKSKPLGPHWKPKNPDIDNLAKSVMDGLNGILWADDRQIVEVRMRKMYASREKTSSDGFEFIDSEHRSRVCIAVRPVGETPKETCYSPNECAEDYWDKGDLQ